MAWWSGRGYLLVTWGHVCFGDQYNFRLNLAGKILLYAAAAAADDDDDDDGLSL